VSKRIRLKDLPEAKRQKIQARSYAQKYPEFEFETNGVDPGFVKLIQDATQKLRLDDPELFSEEDMEVFHQLGYTKGADFLLKMLELAEKLGEILYSRIQKETLVQYIPYCGVGVFLDPVIRSVRIRFVSLRTIKGTGGGGRIYCSTHGYTMTLNGKTLPMGFTRHAVERISARCVENPTGYIGSCNAFGFLNEYRAFKPVTLLDGSPAAEILDACLPCFHRNELLFEAVMGRPLDSSRKWALRVGYCPVVEDNGYWKAVTLLYPGYKNTPEYATLQHLPKKERASALAAAKNLSVPQLAVTKDFSLFKKFHDGGVPQVLKVKEHLYAGQDALEVVFNAIEHS
jgi:hypothetical protein